MSQFTRAKLADVMETEAKKKLVWSPGSEADKFKKKFWAVFGKGKWSWCAATVTWCCEQAGLAMPVKCPSKFGYTFALVEAWQQWAIEKGFYLDNKKGFVPERGDIVCFDWDQKSIDQADTDWENHIGVVLGLDGKNVRTGEGNTSNRTDIKSRSPSLIQGFIRIPDGYSFDGVEAPKEEVKDTAPVKDAVDKEAVKALQSVLNRLGKGIGIKIAQDGIPGPATQAAMLKVAKELENQYN